MSFGVAATTLVGISLGEGLPDKVERYAKTVRGLANIVGCFVGLLFLIFAYDFALLYTTDTAIAGLTAIALRIMSIAQLGQSTQLSTAGALRGAGDTMYPLYASLFGIWVFRVFVAMLFVNVFGWGLVGAWVTLVLDQYARAVVVVLRFRTNKWKTIRELKNLKQKQLSMEA
jgi:Na+-driven multidrug efflux pump